MAKEYTISKEAAEDQLQLFKNYYMIDEDDTDDDDQRLALTIASKKLVKHIRRGHLTITADNDSLQVVQIKLNGDELPYHVLSGRHKVSMDKKTGDSRYKKSYTLIGSITKIGYEPISKFEGPDLSVVENLSVLFLLA